jgi:hypothetical protein|tara:strand:+ start:137 stop:331 length:195 start_codon:yes stop_codon:yes gene_type:complete
MFYQGKVKIEFENDKGKVQKINEVYLVEAVSVTDAEAKLYKEFEGESNFEVVGVTKSRIIKVIK